MSVLGRLVDYHSDEAYIFGQPRKEHPGQRAERAAESNWTKPRPSSIERRDLGGPGLGREPRAAFCAVSRGVTRLAFQPSGSPPLHAGHVADHRGRAAVLPGQPFAVL